MSEELFDCYRIRMSSPTNETCWTVIRAAAIGDSAAQSTFARTYEATIRSYLETRWRGRSLAHDAADAVQEVFVECFKPGGVLERADSNHGEMRGLLRRVTQNVARRFEERAMQKGRVRPDDSAWLAEVQSDNPGQATMFDRCWAHSVISEATTRFRELALQDGESGQRRVELLERRFGSDEAIREIASSWGLPAQDVHNAYKKARKDFYRCLCAEIAFHRPDAADLEKECREVLAMLA